MGLWNTITSSYDKAEKRCEQAWTNVQHEASDASHRLSAEAHAASKVMSQAGTTIRHDLAPVGHAIATGVHAYDKASQFVAHQEQLLAEGVVTGAVLNPVNGIGQLSNHVFGTHLTKLQFSNQNEVDHSVAGIAGEVAGTVVLFAATDGAAAAATGLEVGTIGSMAIAGGVQGAAFTPSNENGSEAHFWGQRAKSTVLGAAAAGAMGAVGGRIATLLRAKGIPIGDAPAATPPITEAPAHVPASPPESPIPQASAPPTNGEAGVQPGERVEPSAAVAPGRAAPVHHVIIRHGVSNTVGGGVGGVVQAEGESMFDYGRLATAAELKSRVGLGAAGWYSPEATFFR